jgi:hypothetical protein
VDYLRERRHDFNGPLGAATTWLWVILRVPLRQKAIAVRLGAQAVVNARRRIK